MNLHNFVENENTYTKFRLTIDFQNTIHVNNDLEIGDVMKLLLPGGWFPFFFSFCNSFVLG